jgi:peptidoglycan/LPS O-acetylase OafA/YrhL
MFVGGPAAVQLFYIISGFLISYILDNNAAYSSPLRFYISRLLRLYPIYAAVAFLTLLSYLIVKPNSFFDVYNSIPLSASLLLVISNLIIAGQDWVMFLSVNGGRLEFTSDYATSSPMLYEGLLVPQAWTLGVEFTFYAVAPLLAKRTVILIVVLLASIGVRLYLIQIGLGFKDPWCYRFFPSELAFFLAGIFSQRILLPVFKRYAVSVVPSAPSWAVFGLVMIVCCYPILPFHRSYLLFGSFVLLLPGTFMFQNQYEFDRKIGDLSYPIYICHYLVIWLIDMTAARIGLINRPILVATNLVGALGFALFLSGAIAKPIENFRTRFKTASSGDRSLLMALAKP